MAKSGPTGGGGYIAVPRSDYDEPKFEGAAFSRREAWHWLLARAAWRPSGVRRRHGVVHLERGQLAITVRELAKQWNWTTSRAFDFLQEMTADGWIMLGVGFQTKTTRGGSPKKSYRISVVTICKYDQFQFGGERLKGRNKQGPEQGTKQGIPYLPGLVDETPAQPLNHRKQESRKVANRTSEDKPFHGARGRGMIWLDYGTQDWHIYASDYRAATGADKLPETRNGGRGNWFRWLGEKKQA